MTRLSQLRCFYSLVFYTAIENGLVYFVYKTVCKLGILVYVYPCAIGTWFVPPSVIKDPLITSRIIDVLHALDVTLDF